MEKREWLSRRELTMSGFYPGDIMSNRMKKTYRQWNMILNLRFPFTFSLSRFFYFGKDSPGSSYFSKAVLLEFRGGCLQLIVIHFQQHPSSPLKGRETQTKTTCISYTCLIHVFYYPPEQQRIHLIKLRTKRQSFLLIGGFN